MPNPNQEIMKNPQILFVVFFFLLILSVESVNSQSIKAGKHKLDDYYYDYEPDTLLLAWYEPGGGGIHNVYFPIDLNNDMIQDVVIECKAGGGLGGGTYYVRVVPELHCQVSLNPPDTCYGEYKCTGQYWCYNTLSVYDYEDLIDENQNWKSQDDMYISVYEYLMSCYNCNYSIESKYIGLRLFINNDTLYSWIKIRSNYATAVTLEEFACNTNITGIEEREEQVKIYPNPFKNIVRIDLLVNQSGIISIFDISGRELLKQEFSTSFHELNLSFLTSGIYILRYESDNEIINRKIIKK